VASQKNGEEKKYAHSFLAAGVFVEDCRRGSPGETRHRGAPKKEGTCDKGWVREFIKQIENHRKGKGGVEEPAGLGCEKKGKTYREGRGTELTKVGRGKRSWAKVPPVASWGGSSEANEGSRNLKARFRARKTVFFEVEA